MRKRICVAGLAMAAITAVAFAALMMIPRPGITRSNFDRIQLGMQKAEVEAILGEPSKMYMDFDERPFATWKSHECMIAVNFVDDCVASKECFLNQRTLWQKMVEFVWHPDPPPIMAPPLPLPPPYPLSKELDSLEEAQRRVDAENVP
jgi:hypothetical protein